ncbi:MAG: S-methyl-5-thioribose-1-phosphate isomerase [Anaerolineae bacterium]|nr:S-methyl-5-thioribose-1-phosphate isomerase [Anaerolineae bacterium]MBT7073940.1 S-methyl-5-thioribose-1-phosphate isomerase [Anaerolineae bacterium]
MNAFRSIEWLDAGIVRMLDQRKLPHETIYNDYVSHTEVAQAIKDMVIRGAPAIGAAAAYGIALTTHHTGCETRDALISELDTAMEILGASRPTAVNLFWAIDRMKKRITDPSLDSVSALKEAVLTEAHSIAKEDVEINKSIGRNALSLIPDKATIIHHCNTGSLATVDYGTALGVIRTAHEQGKNVFALLDETRPRLQGGRLSAYELKEQGVPFKVIVDGASGHFMRTLGVDLCVVGTDRVAANGDVANKIGTYNLAVVAHENNVPFYVAAPTTTIDMATKHGDEIEIEERPPSEITHVRECQITPDGIEVGNPAFDVTPAKYITAIITEKGVVYPPFEESLAKLMR